MNKKFTSLLAAGALIATLGAASALAASPAAVLPPCAVSGCAETCDHTHGGVACAPRAASGCGVSDCAGAHGHGGHHSGRHH